MISMLYRLFFYWLVRGALVWDSSAKYIFL